MVKNLQTNTNVYNTVFPNLSYRYYANGSEHINTSTQYFLGVPNIFIVKEVAYHQYQLLIMFSACDGMRIGCSMPVLTAYFPVLAQGILGKGWLFVTPPLEDCLTGRTGSSAQAGTGCADLQLMADCQALTLPIPVTVAT